MSDILHSPEKADVQKAILDLIATFTKLHIALYEERGTDLLPIVSDVSLANSEKYCNHIQTLPGGKEACDDDLCNLAHGAIKKKESGVTICYAGMYNDAVPILVRGEVRGALIYGQMQIDSPEHRQAAIAKHQEAVKRLRLSPEQTDELRALLTRSKAHKPEELEAVRKVLVSFERWFYTLIDEEDSVTLGVERVTHEIQTRLQAVLAHSENLANYTQYLSHEEVTKMARSVLSSAVALDTVIQTLGGYLGEYKFKPHSISQVLRDAKRIYETEASNRGIEIKLEMPQTDPFVQMSLDHFQHAINNLVHNAVKYSFRSGQDRERYVELTLRPAADGYNISVSNYGVGIVPEEIESRAIFRNGYQGKLTKGEYRTGGGKGLFFAESVIKKHHGRIDATSKLKAEDQSPELKPHVNRFTVFIPSRQPGE
jgi:signal transduction histidine kinase